MNNNDIDFEKIFNLSHFSCNESLIENLKVLVTSRTEIADIIKCRMDDGFSKELCSQLNKMIIFINEEIQKILLIS